ncbi:MAG TPA: carbohydrate kinase [Candidatus Binatia bacterium]|nr:carbohydrate kinase [Candidatus Binatia bacterium]
MGPMGGVIVGLGEVLWDLLPAGRQLGGAPANFAYILHLLGRETAVASRIGDDSLGRLAAGRLSAAGVTVEFIQTDPVEPTGTVKVQLEGGQPAFEISQPAAWDFLKWTREWEALAARTRAVCFGTLAQRSQESRAAIRKFLETAPAEAVRVFDVNLRQTFYSADILAQSMELANFVKCNHEELPKIMRLLNCRERNEGESAQLLIDRYGLDLVCITRGAHGSLLATRDQVNEHSGFKVNVADTVGSGDAFTAGLIHEFLRGSTLAEMNDKANRAGAWVASRAGGMPPGTPREFQQELESFA